MCISTLRPNKNAASTASPLQAARALRLAFSHFVFVQKSQKSALKLELSSQLIHDTRVDKVHECDACV